MHSIVVFFTNSLSSLIILFLLLGISACSKKQGQPYLAQIPPGMEPEVFAPGLVSLPDRSEFGSVFSADGLEFFLGVDLEKRPEIQSARWDGDAWGPLEPLLTHEVYSHNDPFLSPGGDSLFFISSRPLSGEGEKKDIDIWFVKREGNAWSSPIPLGPEVNSPSNEFYISLSQKGNLYFSSNREASPERQHNYDLYASSYSATGFKASVALSDSLNSRGYEADVFIAPDESYIIYCAARREGLGKGDLYISFKDENGNWAKAQNMGPPINTSEHELCPFVSQDGKYLFYTSRQDIYWVDARILETYR